MTALVALTPADTRLAYVAVFLAAALVMLGSLRRLSAVEDEDTRRGLRWLLLATAGWALSSVGYLLATGRPLALFFHLTGLVVGFATLGPWLYFASAYTGRSLHRRPAIRRLAVAVFLAVILVKLTNPWHGLYFELAPASEPFVYQAVSYGVLHWIVTGLAYALAAVAYFMLFEQFLKAGYDTRPLTLLVVLTALPIGLTLLVGALPAAPTISFEPLGVAAFAVGVLFVFSGRFQAVQLVADTENPAIYLGADRRVQDANPPARGLFPALDEGSGEPLAEVVPPLAECLDDDRPILELEGGRQYYRVETEDIMVADTTEGRVLVLRDVSDSERPRRELQRQNERLERFASIISHDLRNPLEVATARVEFAAERVDDEKTATHLAKADGALDRIAALIDDVLEMARQGESIGETEAVPLADLVDRCRETVHLGDSELALASDWRLRADAGRAQQLLGNLVRNAIEHSDAPVTITVGPREAGDGFYVADDGPGIPAEDREAVFESGQTTATDGTGFGLAIVTEIAEAHGWSVGVAESENGGARFDITGVEAA